jgi:hypothetical protein
MRSATSALEYHGRCICALIAPLQEKREPIRWLSHDNNEHKPIVCYCLTIRFIDIIIHVALLGMAVNRIADAYALTRNFIRIRRSYFPIPFQAWPISIIIQ